jgi:NAD(P)-dependent dehydrogenase (short-subunit alcohol dehydrogenase family)
MDQQHPSTWLITGCSTGFGRELARAVVARGYRAVVTARNAAQVEDIVAGHGDRAVGLPLDVTIPAQVTEAVRRAEERFGGIDVLVNNAGIGYFAAVEESDEAEVRRMFEINFFGLARMTRAVLPGMRKRRNGHIINIASICGLAAIPSLGDYSATKFAVEGLSEVLALEVGPLGVRVTLVEPSGFRTQWAGGSAKDSSAREIADYDATAGAERRALRALNGKQPGDPARAANAIIQVVESPVPPLHLLLGKDALRLAREKLDALDRDFDTWHNVTVGADFPAGEPTKVA